MRSVGDTMIISPPLVIRRAEVDELVRLARQALDETARRLAAGSAVDDRPYLEETRS